MSLIPSRRWTTGARGRRTLGERWIIVPGKSVVCFGKKAVRRGFLVEQHPHAPPVERLSRRAVSPNAPRRKWHFGPRERAHFGTLTKDEAGRSGADRARAFLRRWGRLLRVNGSGGARDAPRRRSLISSLSTLREDANLLANYVENFVTARKEAELAPKQIAFSTQEGLERVEGSRRTMPASVTCSRG